MENRQETEQEMRARLKAELKAELMAELKEEQEADKKKPLVLKQTIDTVEPRYNNAGVKEVTDLLNRDKKFNTKSDGPKSFELPRANENSGNLNIGLVIVVVGLILAGAYFLPDVITKLTANEPTKPIIEEPEEPIVELEEITLNSEEVQELTYPIMRNNPYTKKTYYSKKIFNVGDFSNNDLLYNTFIHIYTGNIGKYEGGYNGEACVTADTKKELNANYIEARMANLFTKSVDYEHQSFKVPSTNQDTDYVGVWRYNEKTHKYVYYGNCEPLTASNTRYYDLKVAYDAKGLEKNTVVEVYYHVGFAVVNANNKTYTIYADANLTEKLLTGTLTTNNFEGELQTVFENYIKDGKEAGKYKYKFSTRDCAYQDYCFESGEWID